MTLMIMIPELKDLELHKIWLAGWHFESEKQRTQPKKKKKNFFSVVVASDFSILYST